MRLTDQLNGGDGNDNLNGGNGADSLNGIDNVDSFQDFKVADDVFNIDNAVFAGGGLPHGVLAAGRFVTGPVAVDATDRIIYNSATGALFYDPDGTGTLGQVRFAAVAAGLALTSADFLVV